jgi:hypothetical protein
MTDAEYWESVTEIAAFKHSAHEAARRSTLNFFTSVEPTNPPRDLNWDHALMAASLVNVDATESAQDGALRITQGCLQDESSTDAQKEAASYLLRRLGNGRSADLAATKNLIADSSDLIPSGPLYLDLARRRLSLRILVNGERTEVNNFQSQFWSAATASQWVSLSAPTSVGKSYIVRLWMINRMMNNTTFKAVYLVPTRALIEEVSKELESTFSHDVNIITLPWDSRVGERQREVFVLTQERLHVLMHRYPSLKFDLIFVDEAQKLGDGARGILLQRVIDEATADSNSQVIFASPLTSNPELLVENTTHSSASITSEAVTVNQTLIHATQVPRQPKKWTLSLVLDGTPEGIGEFELTARPQPPSKRLPLVAIALGSHHSGNVVYANGAADAERTAGQIFEALGPDFDISTQPAILDLVELIEKTVHPQYRLATYLKRGVAFHYGNMPLLLREQVEQLFREGVITYLICTSTLLEGVNLPCQNIFVRAPKKGKNTPMSVADFWNLAGRAGRWGVEFQGNIVCVDTDSADWDIVPTMRSRGPIVRASDELRDSSTELLSYIEGGTPVAVGQAAPLLESYFGILAATRRRGRSLASLIWLNVDEESRDRIQNAVDTALEGVDLPVTLQHAHAGISPVSMQRLADHFATSSTSYSELELPPAESNDAVVSFASALRTINKFLGGGFTAVPGRHFALAHLFVEWMRGRPLSVLIANRLGYLRRTGQPINLPSEIRSVLTDVEQYARFQGPLYLSCYSDVLHAAAASQGVALTSPDIAMMMELGVSRTSELSMISLGITRTSAVALSEHVLEDDLTPDGCLEWIRTHDLESLGLPALIIADIQRVTQSSEH